MPNHALQPFHCRNPPPQGTMSEEDLLMAHQVTLQEAAGQLSALVREAQAGREVVLLDGIRPVAKLTPLADGSVSSDDIAQLAMAGGAFDWLADEPDLYDDAPDVVFEVRKRLQQWQQEYGLPPRPDGLTHTPVQELFATWAEEDARLTPEEVAAEQRIWHNSQQSRQEVTL